MNMFGRWQKLRRAEGHRDAAHESDLVGGVSGEFEIRQAHSLIGHLVGAHRCGSLKSDERAIAVQARTARKENDAAFIRVWRAGLKSLRARIHEVHGVEIEERAGAGAVDSRRIEGLRAKPNRAVCDRSAHGHAG